MQEEAERPSISVVMCTFNGERFVAEQLESILSQTVTPDEIIISDDGSSDSTLAVIDKVRQSSEVPVRWDIQTRENPLGPAKNFESALKRATGDVIALADQDDVWVSHKLEVLLERIVETNGALLAHSDALLTDESGRPGSTLMKALWLTGGERRSLVSGNALRALLRRNLVTGATVILAKELRDAAVPIPDNWLHDEWLGLIAALHGGVVFERSKLVRYRQHAANVIGAQQLQPSVARWRLAESRVEFYNRKARRNDALVALVHAAPKWLGPEDRNVLQAKVDFDVSRAALPQRQLARVWPIFRWVFLGRYRDFARGWIDVVRDLSLRS